LHSIILDDSYQGVVTYKASMPDSFRYYHQ